MRLPALLAALSLAAARARPRGGLSFLAIGDWGGASDAEPTTGSQVLTAAGLRRRAVGLGASFTLLMGDNFYGHGVREAADVSTRFHDTFEAVYARRLPKMPFFVCAGNHDYGEGVPANISAQLAYSQLSTTWRFPSLWYKIHREFEAGGQARSLDVLVIDTVVLCGNGRRNKHLIDRELRFLVQGSPGRRRAVLAKQQWAWLEAELKASSADFLWVSGHFPIWSGGSDGSNRCLIDRLRPLLVAHGAQYVSGHDHMLEHFEHEGLQTFVVGAGKECCYPPKTIRQTPQGALRYMLAGVHGRESRPAAPFSVHGGFASFSFGAESAEVAFYAHNGVKLYSAPRIPRRGGAMALLASGWNASSWPASPARTAIVL